MTDLPARYKAQLERRHLSPHTIHCYTLKVAAWHRWCDRHGVTDPTPGDIETYLDEHTWSSRTVNLHLAAISGYYTWLIGQGVRGDNPVAKVARPRVLKGVPKPISEKDLEKAISNADRPLQAILQLGARAGLRAQEVAGLHTWDITLGKRPTLRVENAKGGKVRVVPLAPKVLKALRATVNLKADTFVFPGWTTRGHHTLDPETHITAGTVSRMVSAHLRELGIHSTMHKTRVRFLTKFFAETLDIRATQEVAGHADISTTAGYVAVDMTAAGETVDKL